MSNARIPFRIPSSIAKRVTEVCHRLNQKNYLAAADGNVSVRLNDREILITPTGVNKAELQESQLCLMTIDGEQIYGRASSERAMHLAIYRNAPKARAVVHAHPPTAIAWTIAFPEAQELPSECMSELILAVGRIPIAPFARPGTDKMGDMLLPFLRATPALRLILLARHGAISWGEDLGEAYNGIERLEHSATILKSAVELGGLTSLPPQEVAELRALRAQLGERNL